MIPGKPSGPLLDTPVHAVESYTAWISYAYRVLDSDVATHAFSAYQEVRVDSYVRKLGAEERRALDQRLTGSRYHLVSQAASTATVAGSEDWRYRYLEIDTGRAITPESQASYDVTYTLVVEPEKGWVVDRVQATPRGPVR